MTALKRPLCPDCRDNAGFLCDDVTGLPVKKCPCRATTEPATERDRALAAVEAANPGQSEAAFRIVKDFALTRPMFNANDTRPTMLIAGIENRNVIGAAFRKAAQQSYIRKAGKRPSTDLGTHGHEINEWESLVYRPGRRSA